MNISTRLRILVITLCLGLLTLTTQAQNNGSCKPEIQVQPTTIYCLDNLQEGVHAYAQASSACEESVDLTFTDEVIDLGCSSEGFTGYFNTTRWYFSKINSDGGVDVTGAPNTILVEGANTSPTSASLDAGLDFQIVIPAEGYIAFDWSIFGGSNLFAVQVNEQQKTLRPRRNQGGYYMSDLLHAGDIFHLQLITKSEEQSQVTVENFEFLTNAIEVIERTWMAQSESGHTNQKTQLIAKERATLAEVIIPANKDGVATPKLKNTTSIHPDETGYPLVDRDGNLNTINDQYELKQGQCSFDMTWQDELFSDGLECVIYRKWIITDWCSGSILQETQIIKLIKDNASTGCPEATSGDHSQPGTAEPVPNGQPSTGFISVIPSSNLIQLGHSLKMNQQVGAGYVISTCLGGYGRSSNRPTALGNTLTANFDRFTVASLFLTTVNKELFFI